MNIEIFASKISGQFASVSGGQFNRFMHKNGCFVPLSSNWRTDTIAIQAIAGQPSVMFSFENRSGDGSNMYIDNINMPQHPLAIPGITAPSLVTIYPNPSNGVFQLRTTNYELGIGSTVEIYNVLGEKVYSHDQIIKSSNYQINLSGRPDGVYLYRVLSFDGKMLSEGKLIITK